MKLSCGGNPSINFNCVNKEGFHGSEVERHGDADQSDHRLRSMSALEILRETVRILRYDSCGFLTIAALLICPVSAVLLSNVLVDESVVKRIAVRLSLVARASGLPLRYSIKHSCQRFSEMALSAIVCFPLYITLLLLSKAAVVYSVDCTYSRKRFDAPKFLSIIVKIWRRPVLTYVWACMVIVGAITSFLVILAAVCNALSLVGIQPDAIVYPAMIVGLAFSIVFANAIMICSVSVVISVLEDVSGPLALLRSCVLIRGQTQVGLLIYLVSTMGMAFVEGLFEHRVKTLSYGDGSSRIWEAPLLVIMYSFVLLVDSLMSAVFYFSCRYSAMEAPGGGSHSILETMILSPRPAAGQ